MEGWVARGQRVAVVANPVASGGRGRRAGEALAHRLEAAGRGPCDLRWSTVPGEAAPLVAAALRSGAETVVVVGGDGTFSEAVSGYLSVAPAERSLEARLAAWPCGTGCDFARGVGLRDLRAAWLALLARATRAVDVVGVEPWEQSQPRFFVNVADIGLGAQVAQRAERLPSRLGGRLVFLLASVSAIARLKPVRVRYRLEGGEWTETSCSILVVANGSYFGGGMRVAPQADVGDGLLDLVLCREVGRKQLLTSLLPKVYSGHHLGEPRVTFARSAAIEVDAPEGAMEMDGEVQPSAGGRFRVLPGALALAVPAEPAQGMTR